MLETFALEHLWPHLRGGRRVKGAFLNELLSAREKRSVHNTSQSPVWITKLGSNKEELNKEIISRTSARLIFNTLSKKKGRRAHKQQLLQ